MMVGRLLSFWEGNFSGAMLTGKFHQSIWSYWPLSAFGARYQELWAKDIHWQRCRCRPYWRCQGNLIKDFAIVFPTSEKRSCVAAYLLWYDCITCWGTKKLILTPSHVGYECLQPVSTVSAKMFLLFCPLMAKVSYLTIVQLSGVKIGATSHAIAHDFELPMVFDEWGPARWK